MDDSKTEDKLIILYDGEPDDIFINCDYFRMEQMDDGCWWIGVTKGDRRICFFLNSRGKIKATISEDELHCEYENIDSNTGERLPFDTSKIF